ncbi:hypothetical protein HBI38_190720 [Parastagonospora nodorum]|nr:hypothetical protein HBI79_178610 [Parastagonospora nodorum]KAH5470991.1 hypothetical protein HBI28_155720 [Parastagonospora nodorum]KAH5622469.1 hypothetical protein HBI22_182280 [Parastagonospora nodorum]KAH5707088.1 hypothetical protein HBI20_209530 [Parastagonospora nodorum]KAH5736671.1 hypothetical protein HBI17_193600 [Parastagonospora nodorum]
MSGAEPVGIIGLFLAWKGIVDFGKVINKLREDDTREREVMYVGLQTSQMALADWGRHWEYDKTDGRFVRLEPARKDLINRIIMQLEASRLEAVRKLSKYHESEEKSSMTTATRESRLSRMTGKLVSKAKGGKEKTQWLMGDDTFIAKLVEETDTQYSRLLQLTSVSNAFLYMHYDSFFDATKLGSRMASLEDLVKAHIKSQVGTNYQDIVATASPQTDSIDQQTLAAYATDTITSSIQRERVRESIETSLYHHGDSRVSETIADWWNEEARSNILLIEFPDDAESETATAACALLYYLTDCHKLIFMFEEPRAKEPIKQLLEMVKMFIHSLLSLQRHDGHSNESVSIDTNDLDPEIENTSKLEMLITTFHELLGRVVKSSKKRVLLIVDGLDVNPMDDNDGFVRLVCLFVSGLNDTCKVDSGAIFKPFFAHQGHAMRLYKSMRDTDVVDLTDYDFREGCLRDELASALYH